MRQRLYHRLHELEEASARARKQRESRDQQAGRSKVIQKVDLFLRMCGVEPQRNESLAEALARALGITTQELRRSFASGIDPMHRFLEDRGILAEIERRKAAGTWPSG